MKKTFLQRVKDFADSITPDKEKNEAIIIIARGERELCSADENAENVVNFLCFKDSKNTDITKLLEAVLDKIKERKVEK